MSRNIERMPGAAAVDRNRLGQWLEYRKEYGRSLMDELYNLLEGMYPGKWANCFKSESSIENWRKVWAAGFEKEGITPMHIKGGLEQCVKMQKWPPTLPEFVAACRDAVVRPEHRSAPHDRRVTHQLSDEERARNQQRVQELLAQHFGKKIT